MPLSRDLPSQSPLHSTFKLQFSGSHREYFGLWLANLTLSIITLGIYSPWAKVRRLRYFYQHTTLLGSSFDFHGDPYRILIGRFIAIFLFILYSILTEMKATGQILAFGMVIVCAPFIIQRALRFRLRSTSHRGIRFNFVGSINGALVNAILLPMISAIPLGLTYPFGLREWRRYQLRNATFGKTKFGYDSKIFPFYMMGIASIAPVIFFLFGIAVYFSSLFGGESLNPVTIKQSLMQIGPGFVLVGIVVFLSIRGIYTFYKHRIIFNGLSLGEYNFKSVITLWPCLYIVATNDLLVALSLGLFRPFAAIRAAKLQLTNIEITGPSDVGAFVGDSTIDVSALGTEAVDFFDFDIGL